MSEKTLQFDSFAAALEGIVAQIKGRTVDLSVRHILLVPEKDTLRAEKLLFGGSGAFDTEVYSLSRWFFLLGGSVLPKSGAIMMLKDILQESELKCFYRSKGFDGFCQRLYRTICDFDESGAHPENLDAGGALGLKLNDLAEIIARFKERTKGMYVDKAGKIRLICDRLKKENFLKNTHVYVANFSQFSAVESVLLSSIKSSALSLTVAKVSGQPILAGDIEIYQAEGAVVALKAAAARILQAAKSGTAMEKMCVVLPPVYAQQARRIFAEADIPVYIDQREVTAHSSLGRFVTLMLGTKRLKRADFILLAKCAFCGVDAADADVFENYCKAFLVDYLGFSRPFTLTESGDFVDEQAELERLKTAERVRAKLYKRVAEFGKQLDGAKTTADFCTVIRRLLENAQSREVDAQKAKIQGVLDTMERYLGGEITKNRLSFLTATLKEGMSAESLSTIPHLQGCVSVGDAGIFKGERFDFTLVVGLNEGEIPALAAEDGLITAAETRQLARLGADLGARLDENLRLEYEFLQLLAASKKVFISHFTDSRPSPILYEILESARGKITKTSSERDRFALEFGDEDELEKLCYCRSAAVEILALSLKNPHRLTGALAQILPNDVEKFYQNSTGGSEGGAKKLSADCNIFAIKPAKNAKNSISASQLRTYFSCPYKHFVDYGLRAKRDKSGTASVLDVGNAVHKVCQLYADSGFDDDQLPAFVDRVLGEGVYRLRQNLRQKTRLAGEILTTCSAFGGLIKRGLFANRVAEAGFGEGTPLVGCKIGEYTLRGSMDLVDDYQGFVRVIDYKTGATEFSEKELYYGRGIQLPLYLRVLKENGFIPAAMLFFEFKNRWSGGNNIFSGLYLAERELLLAFDPDMDEQNAALTARIKATKDGEKIVGTGAVSREVLNEYIDYAVNISTVAAGQISQGSITPSPLECGSLSCEYCDFLVACGFSGSPRVAGSAKVVDKKAAAEK